MVRSIALSLECVHLHHEYHGQVEGEQPEEGYDHAHEVAHKETVPEHILNLICAIPIYPSNLKSVSANVQTRPTIYSHIIGSVYVALDHILLSMSQTVSPVRWFVTKMV